MVEIKPGQSSNPNTNFTAIKIGDLDKSSLKGLNSRSSENMLNLSYEVNCATISIKAENDVVLNGIQMQMILDSRTVRYLEGIKFNLTDDNYRLDPVNNTISLSYHVGEMVHIKSGDVLFNISTIESKEAHNQLRLVNTLYNQWYDNDESVNKIQFSKKNEIHSNYRLTAFNSPNPFSQSTDISFEIATLNDRKLDLSIYNLTGQLVYRGQYEPNKGNNTIKITRDNLGEQGVYQYVISYGNDRFTGRMILTN